jgi:hypothetical protein
MRTPQEYTFEMSEPGGDQVTRPSYPSIAQEKIIIFKIIIADVLIWDLTGSEKKGCR